MSATFARLRRGQLGDAAGVLARALFDDPYSEHFFPDERRREAGLRSVERAVLADAWPFHEVHGVFDGDALVGVTAWLPPGAHRQGFGRQLRQLPRLLSVGIRFPGAVGDAIRVADAERRSHVDVPHWWLVVVGVDPEHHGRGAGGAMVEAFVERMERDREPGYLRTTNPENLGFYERFGFEVIDELRVPARRRDRRSRPELPPMWLLWRSPSDSPPKRSPAE